MFGYKGKPTHVIVDVTETEKHIIEYLFVFYLRSWESQQKKFMSAFIQANDLYSKKSEDTLAIGELDEATKKRLKDQARLAQGIEKAKPNKALN